MSTAELIYQKAKILPRPLQAEALHFVDYLLTREAMNVEATDWARFSAEQLARYYSSSDSIYDEEASQTVSTG